MYLSSFQWFDILFTNVLMIVENVEVHGRARREAARLLWFG